MKFLSLSSKAFSKLIIELRMMLPFALVELGCRSNNGVIKMAFYIKIEKVGEDSEKAVYQFIGDREAVGKFSISKDSGELHLLEGMPGDVDEGAYRRASIKIFREWRNGNLPETAEWAS